ncbi:5100_t:CDS:10 [Diversispora eburnea]|uniref:5100_t:CDS:1 n=1 Tax=Diversispora eburnea TaxID=1213867 RepID=A0A9N8WR17_9GLOM|nr:5100_t:CDS:10 [Diversispora eburnea]
MYFSFETIPAFVWVFIATYVVYWIKKPRLSKNEPPMVPYKIPIIGHTLDYLFNAEKFLAKCRQQYGDPFNLYIFGQVTTIAGNEIAHEVYGHSDTFSMTNATRDSFPLYRILKSIEKTDTLKLTVKAIREGLTAKLPSFTERVQKTLMFSINQEIGDCSQPKLINTTNNFSRMVARSVADVLEISKNEDVVNAFADFTKDFTSIVAIPPIFSFIHPKVHTQIITLPLRFGFNPILKHLITLKKHLKPVLEKRLKDKEILGDKYEPPLDIIEYFLNNLESETKVITDDYLDKICDFIFILVIASIHTTSHHTTFALYDFAGRPELWDDLYEEQVKIDKECNGELTPQHINKMVKLDSFLRESLRTFAANPHRSFESYTFKNGTTIPKGRIVQTYLSDIHYNTTAYGPEPRSFLPYHGLENNFPASKTDKDYFVFGAGKHACPGRFFAVHEIKIALHKLILNYHIKTPSGKIEKKIHVGPLALPPNAGLIFESRKK